MVKKYGYTEKKIDVKSIYDLIDKEFKGRFETRNPTDEQKSEWVKIV